MKKYVHSAEDTGFTNRYIVDYLKGKGIDTTKNLYELKAQAYERHSDGDIYTVKFTCPGDYLAYFSMLIHKSPTAANFTANYYEKDDFADTVDQNPTLDDIAEMASSAWYGDGDDFIIYLKNLTTDEYLYGPEEIEEIEEEYEEDWDDDDEEYDDEEYDEDEEELD